MSTGVNIPGVGVRNVVYVATNNDSVYAFDADDPAAAGSAVARQLHEPRGRHPDRVAHRRRSGLRHLRATSPATSGSAARRSSTCRRRRCTSSSARRRTATFVQRLHAIDICAPAARARAAPSLIQASVSGTGDGRDAQNNIAFNARTHNQRAGLLLDHGTVYIAWASYCDQGPYHGWILGYDAASLQQVMVYNTSPDGGLAGIWHSGGGLDSRFARQHLCADRQRIVQRQTRAEGTSATASSRSARRARSSTGSRRSTGRS